MSLSIQYPTVKLLGVDLNALRMSDVLDVCREHIAKRHRLTIGIVNVAKIINARKDPNLRAALDEADIVLADGAPLIWLSRMVDQPLPERIAGIDIMFELLKEANCKHYSIYFLGAKSEVVQEVVKIIQKDYPGVCIAGHRDGYFNKQEEQSVAKEIKNSHPDILFVAISSPKKENFLRRWRNFIDVPVCHGVGGSFDVFAGITKRAPLWMQKSALEWLYRLIQEPRRMWRRYLITNTTFLKLSFILVLQAKLSRLLHRFRLKSVPNVKESSK